ncbi:hypothetical protein [Colwellia sp. RSH04]|uniref:hypothetical protein n=1 Tax=Colwellia sp. RSH04 TaxID=2305464 RepID=UPI002174EE0A|nr:hypothetical protein [Colwellia sp. RSH04]
MNIDAELAIIVLNIVIIIVAYFSIYPKVAGLDINKVAWLDTIASCFALMIVGYKYWGTGQIFSLLFTDVNWFWFTLLSYALLEIPIAVFYFRTLLFNQGK